MVVRRRCTQARWTGPRQGCTRVSVCVPRTISKYDRNPFKILAPLLVTATGMTAERIFVVDCARRSGAIPEWRAPLGRFILAHWRFYYQTKEVIEFAVPAMETGCILTGS